MHTKFFKFLSLRTLNIKTCLNTLEKGLSFLWVKTFFTLLIIFGNIIILTMVTHATPSSNSYNDTHYANQLLKIEAKVNPHKKKVIDLFFYTKNDQLNLKQNKFSNSQGISCIFNLKNTLHSVHKPVDLNNVKNLIQNVEIQQAIDTESEDFNDFTRITVHFLDPEVQINPVIKPMGKTSPSTVSASRMKIIDVHKSDAGIYSPPLNLIALAKDNESKEKTFLNIEDQNSVYLERIQASNKNSPMSNSGFRISNKHYQNIPEEFDTSEFEVIQPERNDTENLLPDLKLELSEFPEEDDTFLAQSQPQDSLSGAEPVQPTPSKTLKSDFILTTDLNKNTVKILAVIILAFSVIISIIVFTISKIVAAKRKVELFPKPIPKSEYAKYTGNVQNRIQTQEPSTEGAEHSETYKSPVSEEEAVAKINVIDGITINEKKDLFWVEFQGKQKLVASIDDDVTIISDVPNQGPEGKFEISKAGVVSGNTMYSVKLGMWEAVIIDKDDEILLHTILHT